MKKIHEHLNQRPSVGDVGIEIETEGKGLNVVNNELWRTEEDGSLRGVYPEECAEYVLKAPIKIGDVEKALYYLNEAQKDAKVDFSFRCSTHVHINVQKLTYPQLAAFLYMTLLLEAPLASYCGEERIGNRFCLRISDAEGYVPILRGLFKNGPDGMYGIREGNLRYSFINVGSLPKYGSIEFRGMRGTMDPTILIPWCQTLYRLREAAKKLGDPIAVHDMYINMGNKEFATKFLGKNAGCYNLDKMAASMDHSFSLTIELPHAYREWEENEKDVAAKINKVYEHPVKAVRGRNLEELMNKFEFNRGRMLMNPVNWEAHPVQILGNEFDQVRMDAELPGMLMREEEE